MSPHTVSSTEKTHLITHARDCLYDCLFTVNQQQWQITPLEGVFLLIRLHPGNPLQLKSHGCLFYPAFDLVCPLNIEGTQIVECRL